MKIRRIKSDRSEGFVKISAAVTRDKTLSLRARGFLLTVWSFPDDWKYTHEGMRAIVPEGRNTIYAILRELEEKGYVSKEQNGGHEGRFTEYVYTFTETKFVFGPLTVIGEAVENPTNGPLTQSRETVSPQAVGPYTVKGTQSTKQLINDSVNKQNINEDGAEKTAPLRSKYDGPEYDHLRPLPPNLKNPQPAVDPLILLEGSFPTARPTPTTAALVRRIVLDTRLWTDILQGWKRDRHNPANVEGMVDRYIKTAKKHGERDDRGIIINRVDRVEGLH